MDIEKIIKYGPIMNELDYERAMIADRRLRLLAKTSTHFKDLRNELRSLIVEYEQRVWSNEDAVGAQLLAQSDQAAFIAEQERRASS